MNVLLIDKLGLFLNFALRCQAAGHSVRWCLGKERATGRLMRTGEGFGLDRRTEWRPSTRWADIILVSSPVAWKEEMEIERKRGAPFFSAPLECVKWELDRGAGQGVLESFGVKCIPYHEVKNIADARAFLRANPRRYVSKADSWADDNLTYVAKSAKDLDYQLGLWEKEGRLKGRFMLQEFIPGIEVAVGGWFGDSGFASWYLENFEHKKLMNGDIGPNTGEMGTVLHYTQTSALADTLLRPLEPILYRCGYRGYIDVSAIVAKDGTPYPLEFTCRHGWPLFDIQQALHPEPVEWMHSLMHGADTFAPKRSYAVGVQMALPPFPQDAAAGECYGTPLYGWDAVPEHNLHFRHVAIGEAPDDSLGVSPIPVTTNADFAVVSGLGASVAAAQSSAYRNVKRLELPCSPMYRTDIGDRVIERLADLQRLGWCEEWEIGTR